MYVQGCCTCQRGNGDRGQGVEAMPSRGREQDISTESSQRLNLIRLMYFWKCFHSDPPLLLLIHEPLEVPGVAHRQRGFQM